MGYQLKNKLEVVIEFEVANGQYEEFPIGNYSTLTELNMTESTKITVPTLYLKLEDGLSFFDTYPLLDGRRIKVSIIALNVTLHQCIFRVYDHISKFNGTCNTITIDAYLDCPVYWFSSSCQSYRGSSATVIAEVARLTGMKANVVATHDSQLWMQGNMTYADFVDYLTAHSYKTTTSYMMSGLTLASVIILKDVNDIPTLAGKIVQHTSHDSYYTATDLNVSSNSGLNNQVGGYASLMYEQTTSEIDVANNSLDVALTETNLNLNREVLRSVYRSHVQHSFLSADVNDNFWRGTYQNFRYAKLYNVNASIIINQPATLTLLDKINVSTYDTEGKANSSDSGNYIIHTKCIIIRGTNYAERLGACRIGVN